MECIELLEFNKRNDKSADGKATIALLIDSKVEDKLTIVQEKQDADYCF